MRSDLEDARWQAVLGRDRSASSAFVFAVRSTGIYCRPTCPARRPRRQQVLFFDAPGPAEKAGFRACRRCRPATEDPNAWVERACRLIESHEDGPVTLGFLSAEVGLSKEHVQRVFKRVVGVTPRAYSAAWRLSRLRANLRKGADVTGSIFEAGYGSLSRVYEGDSLGMTPRTYGRGAPGVEIHYAIVPSPLGRLLVAATSKGIAKVALGDDDASLEAQMQEEYKSARLVPGGGEIAELAQGVLKALEGSGPVPDLPMDIQATAFQRKVWEALKRIPRGETRSYAEVARSVGRPGAARAVARACSQNPVAVVIPCHRVIAQDGSPSGYRWGRERKEKLLRLEAGAGRSRSSR